MRSLVIRKLRERAHNDQRPLICFLDMVVDPVDMESVHFMFKRLSRPLFFTWLQDGLTIHLPQTLHSPPIVLHDEKRFYESALSRWIYTHTTTNTATYLDLVAGYEVQMRKVTGLSNGATSVFVQS
jgi:hypothetical protein